jgi:hypothetical protein
MRRDHVIRLCVVTLCAVFAATPAAAGAQGQPERGTCKSKAKGKYQDNLCLDEGGTSKGHEFEWTPAASAAFTAMAGAATLRSFTPEGTELPAVECQKSATSGEENSTTSRSVVTFEECSSAGEKCASEGATAGEIVTFPLEGELGVIEESGPVIGEDLVGTGAGGILAEFKCGANELELDGSVIGEVTPLDEATSEFALTFRSSGSKQDPESLQGGSKDTLATEIDGLGGGTFPFSSTLTKSDNVKGAAKEVRMGPGPKGFIWRYRKNNTEAAKELATGTKFDLNAATTVTEEPKITGELAKAKFEIKCSKVTKANSPGVELENKSGATFINGGSPGTGAIEAIKFVECAVMKPANCKLKILMPGKAEIEITNPSMEIVANPSEKDAWLLLSGFLAIIRFEGTKCALNGKSGSLRGELVAKVNPDQATASAPELQFPDTAGTKYRNVRKEDKTSKLRLENDETNKTEETTPRLSADFAVTLVNGEEFGAFLS